MHETDDGHLYRYSAKASYCGIFHFVIVACNRLILMSLLVWRSRTQVHSSRVWSNTYTWPVHHGTCINWLYDCDYNVGIDVPSFCLRLKCNWQVVLCYLGCVLNTGSELTGRMEGEGSQAETHTIAHGKNSDTITLLQEGSFTLPVWRSSCNHTKKEECQVYSLQLLHQRNKEKLCTV